MNALKKLAGLLVFVAALAGAVAVSKYFSAPRAAPAAEAPAPQLSPPAPPPRPDAPAPAAVVRFKPQLVLLDFSGRTSYVTLELEREPDGPAPERVWAWAEFFPAEGGSRARCAGAPVEVRRPFMRGRRATVVVEMPAHGCAAPRAPAATYYARVNVSAESAEAAARPPGDQNSYDITKATPVVVQGAGR